MFCPCDILYKYQLKLPWVGNEILQYKYPCYVTVYRCIDITFSLYDFYISNDCKLQVIFNCFNYLMWVDMSRLYQSKARRPGLQYKQLILKNSLTSSNFSFDWLFCLSDSIRRICLSNYFSLNKATAWYCN